MKDEIYIAESIDKFINEKIAKAEAIVEKNKNVGKEGTKVGFFDKLTSSAEVKRQTKKLQDLKALQTALFKFTNAQDATKKMPDDIMAKISELCALMPEEGTKLSNLTTAACLEANRNQKELIQKYYEEVKKLLQTLNMSQQSIMVYDDLDKYTGKNVVLQIAAESIRNDKLSKIGGANLLQKGSSLQNVANISDELFIKDIEEMIQTKDLNDDPKFKEVAKNIVGIKSAFAELALANKVLSITDGLTKALQEVSEIDCTKIIAQIKQMITKAQIKQQTAQKYLSRFDFNHIREEVNTKKAEKAAEKSKENQMEAYQNLAKELAKVQAETPEDIKKISEIEAQMRATAQGLSNSDLMEAIREGKNAYNMEQITKKADKSYLQEVSAARTEAQAAAATSLRNAAIEQLKLQGELQDSYTYQSGDVRTDKSVEEKIQHKMKQLQEMAALSPEERGLREYKKLGIVPEDARVQDLTMTQLNDIRIAYGDNHLGITDYRKHLSEVRVETEATPLFKEYLKYRAASPDKTACMSFKAFAAERNIVLTDEEDLVSGLSGGSR